MAIHFENIISNSSEKINLRSYVRSKSMKVTELIYIITEQFIIVRTYLPIQLTRN